MLSRNRFWWYRSLYDDYCSREIRLTFGIASLLWLPHYWLYFKNKRWGIHLNREIEVNYSHRNYQMEFGPRRNRLTHSLLFEEFEVVMENW
jgi:hypothetical protein